MVKRTAILTLTAFLFFAGIAFGAFPTNLDRFASTSQVIRATDIDNIEAAIGTLTATSTNSINYLIRNSAAPLGSIYSLSPATGTLLYWANSIWNALAIGSTGKVLTVTAGLPAWETATGGASSTTINSLQVASFLFRSTSTGIAITSTTPNFIDIGVSTNYFIPLSASGTNYNTAYDYINGSSSNLNLTNYRVTQSSSKWDAAYQSGTISAWVMSNQSCAGSTKISSVSATGGIVCTTDETGAGGVDGTLSTSTPVTAGFVGVFSGLKTFSGTSSIFWSGTSTQLRIGDLYDPSFNKFVSSSVTFATTTVLDVFNVTSSGNKAFMFTLPAKGSDIYTPSTTVETITAGDALTKTGQDIDFDGGTAPGGELGGTWGTPTIDDGVTVDSWILGNFTFTNATGTVRDPSGNLYVTSTVGGGGSSTVFFNTFDINWATGTDASASGTIFRTYGENVNSWLRFKSTSTQYLGTAVNWPGQNVSSSITGAVAGCAADNNDIVYHPLLKKWLYVCNGTPLLLGSVGFNLTGVATETMNGLSDAEGIGLLSPATTTILVMDEENDGIVALYDASAIDGVGSMSTSTSWNIPSTFCSEDLGNSSSTGFEDVAFIPDPSVATGTAMLYGGYVAAPCQDDGKVYFFTLNNNGTLTHLTAANGYPQIGSPIGPIASGWTDLNSLEYDWDTGLLYWEYGAQGVGGEVNKIVVTDLNGTVHSIFSYPSTNDFEGFALYGGKAAFTSDGDGGIRLYGFPTQQSHEDIFITPWSPTTFYASTTFRVTSTFLGNTFITNLFDASNNRYVSSSIVINTTTAAGTWNVTSSGNKTFMFTIPPAKDQYFAPSTTIPTLFLTVAPATTTINTFQGAIFDLFGIEGVTTTVSNGSTTFKLRINNSSTQTCSGNDKISSVSSLGIVTCTTDVTSAGSTGTISTSSLVTSGYFLAYSGDATVHGTSTLFWGSTSTQLKLGDFVDPSNNKYSTSTGGGTPGGSDSQIQFNTGGAFGGKNTFYFTESSTAPTVTVSSSASWIKFIANVNSSTDATASSTAKNWKLWVGQVLSNLPMFGVSSSGLIYADDSLVFNPNPPANTPGASSSNWSIIQRSFTKMTVSASTASGTVASTTIPANLLGTNKGVRMHVQGVAAIVGTTTPTITPFLTFGSRTGTVMWSDVSASMGTSSAQRTWRLEAELWNAESSSVQIVSGVFYWGATSTANNGTGEFTNQNLIGNNNKGYTMVVPFYGTSSKDTTVAQDLHLDFAWSIPHVGTAITSTIATYELIQ